MIVDVQNIIQSLSLPVRMVTMKGGDGVVVFVDIEAQNIGGSERDHLCATFHTFELRYFLRYQ